MLNSKKLNSTVCPVNSEFQTALQTGRERFEDLVHANAFTLRKKMLFEDSMGVTPFKEDTKRSVSRRSKQHKNLGENKSPAPSVIIPTKQVLVCKLSANDYYERNLGGKTLCYVPIYLFDVYVTEPGRFQAEFSSAVDCLRMFRILVLGPNGRVLASSKKSSSIVFETEQTGQHSLKFWLGHLCTRNFTFMRELRTLKPQMIDQQKVILLPAANLFKESAPRDDSRVEHDGLFYLTVSQTVGKGEIDAERSQARVYSLLAPGRQASLYKGEKLKEKCCDRHVPTKRIGR